MKVYVTSHGKRFHDPLRHYMTGSGKVLIDKRAAKREGYQACAFCFDAPPARPAVGRNPSRAYLRLHRQFGRRR